MNNIGCFFCNKFKDQKGIIYQNEYFFSIFDDFPISPGHCLIVPNKHKVSFFDLSEEESEYLKLSIEESKNAMQKVDKKILYQHYIENPVNEKAKLFAQKMMVHNDIDTKAESFNIGINEGLEAGRTVHHLHIHLIPRFQGYVEDPRGGVRFVIPNLANYK